MKMTHGMVFWVTGLAGAGKTTIGTALYEKIKKTSKETVLLDGDTLREVFGNDLGYTSEDRFKCAMRYSRLCKLLSDQGINVICCTISMFNDVRQWNRDNIASYMEIYVKADNETLMARNQKQLYSSGAPDVTGVSAPAQLPENPHITINNDGNADIQLHIDEIAAKIRKEWSGCII